MHVPNRPRHLVAALIATLAVGTAACGDADAETSSSADVPDEQAGQTTEVDPPDASSGGADADDDGERADDPVVDDKREEFASEQAVPPTASSTDGEVLVSVSASPPFEEIRVLDLRRDGDVVTLEFEVEAAEHDRNIGVGHDRVFAAGFDQIEAVRQREDIGINEASSRGGQNTVSAVSLVDRDNGNRHLVLRDSAEECLCTKFPGALMDSGDVYRHSAQFPAPPEDVTSMTIEFPNAPSVDTVPIREVS